MSFYTPSVSIAGLPVTEQDIVWQLTAGVTPYTTDIRLPKNISEQLNNVFNPTYMEIKAQGGTELEPKISTIKFENIYLHDPISISDFHTMWKISDSRFAFRGKKVFCAYNLTRAKNEKGNAISGTTPSPKFDPVELAKPFRLFAKGRYLEWSVQTNGEPWGVYQIIYSELKKLGIPFDYTGNSGDYIIENVRYEGESVYTALADLLSKARLSLGIKSSGKLYVYSLDFLEKNNEKYIQMLVEVQKTRPGVIYKQDLIRVRPRTIKVRFERKEEVITKMVAPNEDHRYIGMKRRPTVLSPGGIITQDMINDRRAFGCVNVLPVPFPTKIAGREYNIGEYAPMKDFIESIPFTEKNVRELWFMSLLELKLTEALLGGSLGGISLVEPLAATLAASIRQHYRQTFMLDPVIFTYIDDWEVKRTAIIDNYSQYSPPSPVYVDFCMFPKFRSWKNAREGKLFARNWKVNVQDPTRTRANTLKTLQIIDKELGVFRLFYNNDVTMTVDQVVPSAVLPEPTYDPREARFLLENSKLDPDFTMEAIISVLWGANKDGKFDSKRRYFDLDFDFSNGPFGNSLGPPITFLSRRDKARVNLNGFTTNRPVLDAIAQVEQAKLINSYKDRYVGVVTTPGWRQEVRVEGNIKSIIYSFNERSGATTTIDMRDIPPAPTLEQALPPAARAYLFRQVHKVP